METITLFTSDAEEVTTIVIPLFTPRADVIFWGVRCFVWNNATQKYTEVFAYVVPIANND